MVNVHGRFAWYELMTTDMEAAKAFYTKVMGWGAQDASVPGMAYVLFTAGKAVVGGLMDLPEDARRTGAAGGSDMSGSMTWTLPPTVSSALAEQCTSHRQTSPTSAAFHLRRPANGNARVAQMAEARPARPAELVHRAASAGTSCLPPTGKRRWPSTASFSAGRKRTPRSERWAHIRCSLPPGRRSAACSPSRRRSRFPSGSIISTSATSMRRRRRVKAGGGQILDGPFEVPGGSCIVRCVDPQGAMFALEGKRARRSSDISNSRGRDGPGQPGIPCEGRGLVRPDPRWTRVR